MHTTYTECDSNTTETRILASAEREFMLKGYAGARTTAIAEAAGVTHAMLHYYFRTKDRLFETVVRGKIGALHDIMLASLGNPTVPLFDKLEDTVSRHLDFIAANPDLPRFMISEVFPYPDRMPVVLDTIMHHAPLVADALQRQIDDYAARGLCRRVDAGMLMLDIVSLNIFPFMARAMVNPLLNGLMEDTDAFVAARKRENIDTIMRKLKI